MRQFIDTLNESAIPEAAGDGLNYDLKAKYDEFNTRFFNGELPACKVRFGVLKGKGGHCTCKMRPPAVPVPKRYGQHKHTGYTLVPNSLAITISSAYTRSADSIDGILLHEMIHAWFFYKEQWEVRHGAPFLRMRADLIRKSGIDIPLTDDTRDLEFSDEVGTKRVAVLLKQTGSGQMTFALVNAKAMETVKTRALEKVKWIDQARFMTGLHVAMKIVSGPYWTKKAMQVPVGRAGVKTAYFMKPGEKEEALAEFATGEDVFEFYGADATGHKFS